MKKRMGLLVVLTLLGSLVMVPSARAGTTVREFTAREVGCMVLSPGEGSLTGDILHVRDAMDVSQIFGSNEPLVSGTDTIHVSYNVNITTGNGAVHGTAVIQPEGVNGTWEFHFAGPLRSGLFSTHTVGHGTGELAGQIIMMDIQQVRGTSSNSPCPGGPEYTISGRILDPGA